MTEQAPGGLELTGRITTASNATFLGVLDGAEVVYKPTAGERPLWDFPDRDLARREVASYLVSEQLGWNVVPRTWLGDGQFGPGMLQLWQDIDPDVDAVDLVHPDDVPESGWRQVLEGEDHEGAPVALLHEDSQPLRCMALFDVVVNNADRKGGHVLAMPDGHRFGVDHGLTFHPEPHLRTVLWGWVGDDLSDAELTALRGLRDALGAELGERLSELLGDPELEALADRLDELIEDAVFPLPGSDMPAVPYPLF